MRAARLAAVGAEADLVGADVEHGRRGRRAQLVEEEPELPPARAERDGVDELHPGEGTGHGRRSARAAIRVRATWSRTSSPRPARTASRLMCRSGTWDGPLADGVDGHRVAAPRRPGRRPGGDRGRASRTPASCSRSTTTPPGSTRASRATRCSGRPCARARRLPAAPARDGHPRRPARDVRPADRVPPRGERSSARSCARLGAAVATREGLVAPHPGRPPRGTASRSRARRRSCGSCGSLDLERLREPRHGGRPAAPRPRARDRPVVGRRDRARGARPLRPRPRRRPRARQARLLARGPLGRGRRDGGAARAATRSGRGSPGQILMLGWSRGLIPGADPRRRPPHAAAHEPRRLTARL